eukprot:TRINITY_DN11125_c0_g2_i2.p1 TRINITY_DN11125_c0_g2~~TRINITY_DN11125_c0_g2_i2.p1  ORF type:complete len:123 (-),score=22.11 TRINITY_DN11125_c0_g2_i2:193-561(-)
MAENAPPSSTVGPDVATHERLTQEMFEKMVTFMEACLSANTSEYNLLADLNQTAASRYESMTQKTIQYNQFLEEMMQTYTELQPYLNEIDDLHRNVQNLHVLVNHLDSYTKKLESQFKKVYS